MIIGIIFRECRIYLWLTYHRQVLQAGYDHAQLQWLWRLYLVSA